MATTPTTTKHCECGCGAPAPIARRNRGDYRKGDPKRFVNGYHVRLRRVARAEYACRTCSRRFAVCPGAVASNARRGRGAPVYCSQKCRSVAGKTVTACARCGESFSHWRSVPRTYCSHACARVAPARVSVTCVVCSGGYDMVPSRRHETKCCSFACLITHVARRNTRHGLDARTRCGRKAWRQTRRVALNRDGHACRVCGTTDDLTVHHMEPWRKSKNDSLHNLITLCRACHYRVEYLGADLPASRQGAA